MPHDRLSHLFPSQVLPWNDPPMPCAFGLPAAAPQLVAVAIHPSLMAAAQEIYRLAYERAVASTRPSRYELARRACPN